MRVHGMLVGVLLCVGCGEATPPPPAVEQSATVDVSRELDACAGCHRPGRLDLSTQSRADLRAKLDAIRAATVEHPTDLRALTDAQLEAIAASLAGP